MGEEYPKSDHQTISNPATMLKARVFKGDGPATIDPGLLEKAERAVRHHADEYEPGFLQQVHEFAVITSRLESGDEGATPHAALFATALALKSDGLAFGFQLIAEIALLMTGYLERNPPVTPRTMQVLNAFSKAMGAVVSEDLRGDGGEVGAELIRELGRLVNRSKPQKTKAGEAANG